MTSEYDKYKLPQRWFDADYTQMLYGLLPKGIIWVGRHFGLSRVIQDVIQHQTVWQDNVTETEIKQDIINGGGATGDLLMRLLSCFASELARLEAAAWDIVNQSDPGVATTLLEDWERVLGLPGECFGDQELTVEERQVNAHVKLFGAGQITTMQWYEDIATALGFTITLEENPATTNPRIFGAAGFGDEAPPFGGRGGYANLNITALSAGNEKVLKCIYYKFKPAHVIITKFGSEWNP